MSSGWFDCTETFLSTSLKGKQSVQGAYALVRGGSNTSNLIKGEKTYTNPCNDVDREGSVQSNHPELM